MQLPRLRILPEPIPGVAADPDDARELTVEVAEAHCPHDRLDVGDDRPRLVCGVLPLTNCDHEEHCEGRQRRPDTLRIDWYPVALHCHTQTLGHRRILEGCLRMAV